MTVVEIKRHFNRKAREGIPAEGRVFKKFHAKAGRLTMENDCLVKRLGYDG